MWIFKPLFIFHVAVLAIIIANFPSGKFFLGWDSLNPEFNFSLNLQRAFFAFWQENYGLGLLGGHGFAATLPHSIITFILSLIAPVKAIRPIFTFLCLYLGGLGTYYLVNSIIDDLKTQNSKASFNNKIIEQLNNGFFKLSTPYIALFSALFYMLNLGTVQMFYAQLEAFIVHFAALPWLFWIILRLMRKITKKNLFLFLIINFFASVQGFIPSLFAAYIVSLIIFLGAYLYQKRLNIASIKTAGFILFLTIIINSYWLFPLTYYKLTREDIYLNSYNNLTSTAHFIEINKQYGDISNAALLKGFLFESHELGDYILRPWINHFDNRLVKIIGYAFFSLAILGVISSILFFRNWLTIFSAGIFSFFFLNLATNTPPFSYIPQLLQQISPTYEQAFRIAFTKFSLGFAFSESLLISLGLLLLISLLNKLNKKIVIIFFSLAILSLFFYSLPAFKGHYLYKKMMIDVPKDYFAVSDYFKKQKDGRIADFPQDCPEGWFSYNFGYFGSGFYWYSIKQPFLARSFDVWSNYNENYYFEITQALKEQNFEKAEKILQKYDVKWVLYDPNLLGCRNQRNLINHEEFISYLETASKDFTLAKTFNASVKSPIKLFENKKNKSNSFIKVLSNLKNTGPVFKWNENDQMYLTDGDYISSSLIEFDIFYPFRSLFTKRKESEKEFELVNKKDSIILTNTLPKGLEGYLFKIPDYKKIENNIPLKITLKEKSLNIYEAYLAFIFPQIFIDDLEIWNYQPEIKIGQFFTNDIENINVLINEQEITNKNQYASDAIFYSTAANEIQILNSQKNSVLKWNSENDLDYQNIVNKKFLLKIPYYEKGIFKIIFPKTGSNSYQTAEYTSNLAKIAPESCNERIVSKKNKFEVSTAFENEYIRLISEKSSQCLIIPFPDLFTSSSYLLEVTTRTINGTSPKLFISNKERVVFNEVSLKGDSEFKTLYFIIPPTFKSELGYDIYIQNISENNALSINDFSGLRIWPIPYNFLKSLKFESNLNESLKDRKDQKVEFSVSHPNNTFYSINFSNETIKQLNNNVLVLSQSFDPGWKAYSIPVMLNSFQHPIRILKQVQDDIYTFFPFLFGTEIKDHVLVNNWANGWIIQDQKSAIEQLDNGTIVIFFWPQYIQFIGFLLLFATIIYIAKYKTNN